MKRIPQMISENDYKSLERALAEHREITLERNLGTYKIVVSVVPVGKGIDVWKQTHVITVEEYCRNVYRRKNCKDTKELRWYLSG